MFVFTNMTQIQAVLETDLMRPAGEQMSASELIELWDEMMKFDSPILGQKFDLIRSFVKHAHVSSRFLKDKLFSTYSFSSSYLTNVVEDRSFYSDDLLCYVVTESGSKNSIWGILLSHFADGVIAGSQVDIMWEHSSLIWKFNMVECALADYMVAVLPDKFWVEYYLLCQDPEAKDAPFLENAETMTIQHFGDIEILRLAIAEYLFKSTGVDGSKLPFSWLVELGVSQICERVLDDE